MIDIKMISVVRNFEMYNRLVKNNLFNQGAEFVAFDNNQENLGISVRYNSFLDNYDYSKEAWFVFCHEDWEVKENLPLRLQELNKNCLYGPIGAPFSKNKFMWSSVALGQIEQSDKNGAKLQICGRYNEHFPEVGTFDCQCLIVHSSLVQKHRLRFDENLNFDLYVEDFCINARENYNISSKVLQLKCCHWSFGNVGERFFEKLAYLQKKYKSARNFYISTVGCHKITEGTLVPFDKILSFCKKTLKYIFQIKKTKSNKLLIKVFRIPVFSKALNITGKHSKPIIIERDGEKSKGVIYTCITGNYDSLIQHNCVNKNYDYVCFTDNKELIAKGQDGIWIIKPLAFSQLDNIKNARWHKMHPHTLFPDYDLSIWIDSNGDILSPKLFEMISNSSDKNFLVPKHFARDCIYDEIFECVICKKENLHNAAAIEDLLIAEKMPRHYGLNETNILVRRHNKQEIMKLMEEWWLFIENKTKRDQLSLSYVLWKNDIKPEDISFENARFDTNNFLFVDHKENIK